MILRFARVVGLFSTALSGCSASHTGATPDAARTAETSDAGDDTHETPDAAHTGTARDAGHADAAPDAGPMSCDPLAPPAVTLGMILGVAASASSNLCVGDEVLDGGQQRVFVSSGSTLYRKHVTGSGSDGVNYAFNFQDNLTDSVDARTLFIQGIEGFMALGPANQETYGGPDAGDQPLDAVDAGVISGLAIRNLPYVVAYVADVSNGDAIVITESMDDWSMSDERLFYGKPPSMIEYPVTQDGGDCCDQDFYFTVDGMMYQAHFQLNDGAGLPPSGLYMGGSTSIPLTLRSPTPTTLDGFSFTCL